MCMFIHIIRIIIISIIIIISSSSSSIIIIIINIIMCSIILIIIIISIIIIIIISSSSSIVIVVVVVVVVVGSCSSSRSSSSSMCIIFKIIIIIIITTSMFIIVVTTIAYRSVCLSLVNWLIRCVLSDGRACRQVQPTTGDSSVGSPAGWVAGQAGTEDQNYHPRPPYRAPCMKYVEGSGRPIYLYRPRKYVIPGP